MKAVQIALTFLVLLAPTTILPAATTLNFWHSYIHALTREPHYGFHLDQFKRGLFWGSCGPSTKSLQWSFTFDLSGNGPVYDPKNICLSDDNGKTLQVVSGAITKTCERSIAKIDLQIETEGRTNNFIGNGTYQIHQAR
jgi:hypothetical protein